MRKLRPITPGDLLLEEFSSRRALANIDWLRKSAFRRSALAKSSPASAPSPPTLICGCVASSAFVTVIGLRAQAMHDTEVAERSLGSKLDRIKPWRDSEADEHSARTRA